MVCEPTSVPLFQHHLSYVRTVHRNLLVHHGHLLGEKHHVLHLCVQPLHNGHAVVLLRLLQEAHHAVLLVDGGVDAVRLDHAEDVRLRLRRAGQLHQPRDVPEAEREVGLRQPLDVAHVQRVHALLHQAQVLVLLELLLVLRDAGAQVLLVAGGVRRRQLPVLGRARLHVAVHHRAGVLGEPRRLAAADERHHEVLLVRRHRDGVQGHCGGCDRMLEHVQGL
mmetsp:Transcript_14250/g.30528  ORF Transcript_14250/g.30528 Transcript_14250/m.30528 type:complete len:222 (+) Transcript_14250:213-878(+)